MKFLICSMVLLACAFPVSAQDFSEKIKQLEALTARHNDLEARVAALEKQLAAKAQQARVPPASTTPEKPANE